jgi:hypothetical protein
MDATGIHQKHQKLYVYICTYMYTCSSTTTANWVRPTKYAFVQHPKWDIQAFCISIQQGSKEWPVEILS